MKKHFILFVLMTATFLGAESMVPMTIQTFPVQYADLDEMREMIEPLVAPNGRVTVNRARRQLVVMAEEQVMEPVRQLLEQIDTLPKNVRIHVRFDDSSESRLSEAGVKAKGEVVVQNSGVSGNVVAKPFLAHQRTTNQSMTDQNLMVMSGREGRLRVGERIPYADYFIQYGIGHGYLEAAVRWEDVGASLLIEPTVIGDGPMIQVRVIPEISASVDGERRRVQYASAATEITIRDGETLRIGGLTKDEDFYSRFLLGFSKGGDARQLDIFITPEILP